MKKKSIAMTIIIIAAIAIAAFAYFLSVQGTLNAQQGAEPAGEELAVEEEEGEYPPYLSFCDKFETPDDPSGLMRHICYDFNHAKLFREGNANACDEGQTSTFTGEFVCGFLRNPTEQYVITKNSEKGQRAEQTDNSIVYDFIVDPNVQELSTQTYSDIFHDTFVLAKTAYLGDSQWCRLASREDTREICQIFD